MTTTTRHAFEETDMSVQILRFTTAPERIPEVEEAVTKLFAAVDAAGPDGIDYTAMRVGQDGEFVLILRLADANPLLDIPQAQEFRARLAEWARGPVAPRPAVVLGRYTR